MPQAPALVVLDTCVVSSLMSGDATAAYYRAELQGLRAAISFQTREEALFGALRRRWGSARMNALRTHLDQYEVVAGSLELTEISASLRSERERAGRQMKTADAWIAATALLSDCPLASGDGGFVGIPGLELIRAPAA